MTDVLMSEVLSDRSGIVTVVRQLMTTGTAQHAWVNLKRDASQLTGSLDDMAYRRSRQGPFPFGREYRRASRARAR